MFKPGDLVKIIDDPPEDEEESPTWVRPMDQFCGRTLEVELVDDYGYLWFKEAVSQTSGYRYKFNIKWVTSLDPAHIRIAHRDNSISEWQETEQRIRARRDAHFRKLFGE